MSLVADNVFEIFPWNENFETGIDLIDEQHKQLINILNRLAEHLAYRSNEIILNNVFNELADYADYHFKTEEQIWKNSLKDDDWLTNHEHTHQSFISEVIALKEETKPLDDVIQNVVSFLSKWLAYHILESDKRMSIVVKAIDAGESIEQAKITADKMMSGSMKVFINTVLTMYDRLSLSTVDLMREKALREQAEKELAISNEQWKFILEGGTESVWDWDIEHNKTIYSDNYSSLFDIVSGKQKTIEQGATIHAEDIESLKSVLNAHLEGETDFYNHKYRIIRKDGSCSWMLSRGKVVSRDEQGNSLRMVGTHSDITEHEMASLIYKHSEQAIFITDSSNKIISINPAFTAITGYTKDQVVGKNPNILSSGKQSKDFYKQMWESINNKGFWSGEVWNKCKNGKVYLENLSITLISDGPNSVRQYVALFSDITDRWQAEEKLKLSARVFSDTHEGILITNKNKEIIDVNPAFCEISGYSREDVIGQNPNILRSGKQSPQFYSQLWENIETKGYWQGEIWNCKKDGTFYVELLTISSLLDDKNKVTNYVGVFTDVTHSKRQQEQLQLMAHYDVLTGLPNRALLLDRFNQAIAHSNRTKLQLAICFLDLDNFKPVNDNFGHEAGDKLLVEVAQRILACIRVEDTVSRQGGDEFAILLNDIDSIAQCKQSLERIHHSLRQPYNIGGFKHKVSVSTGVTMFPADKGDIDTLLRHADQAMYQSKQQGRNRFSFFNTEQEREDTLKHHRLYEIKQALDNKEFQLYYQPKVNMRTGEVFGVEALIRWIHPEKGLIPPLEFLPIIDGSKLEIQIGNWVINEALQQLDCWYQQGLELEVSINISSYHLQASNFLDQLYRALDKYPRIDSQKLQLEILESSALGDIDIISGIVKSCQSVLGIKVALDDFGTGYSSLTHMRNLNVDTIKIDQSFVRDMLEDRNDLAMIEGIVSLAKTFNRQVIAEGVETAEHGILLMRIGCDYAQGYGIARPMPADNIIIWMQEYIADESWSLWSDFKWELCNLPLMLAQSDHIKWVEEILKVLQGKEPTLKTVELTDHLECRLGKWYYTLGKDRYGDLPAFSELEQDHIKIHQLGQQITLLYSEGKKDDAIPLTEELLTLKSKVLEKLQILQREVNFLAE